MSQLNTEKWVEMWMKTLLACCLFGTVQVNIRDFTVNFLGFFVLGCPIRRESSQWIYLLQLLHCFSCILLLIFRYRFKHSFGMLEWFNQYNLTVPNPKIFISSNVCFFWLCFLFFLSFCFLVGKINCSMV